MILTIKIQINRILMRLPILRWAKLTIELRWKLKGVLQRQLRFASGQPVHVPTGRSKRVLLTQIETSHYQFYQMLILAKALQLRAAEVKVLLCGSRLEGCELKSVKNSMVKDVCLNCRFNRQHVVPMFGLEIIQLSDFISDEEMKSLKELAAGIAARYPSHFAYEGIDIIPMTDDSVTRYYYGEVPSNKEQLRSVREQHLTSSMIGIHAAQRIDDKFSPNIILNNMFVYSVSEPYYKYFADKEAARLFSVTLTPADYHSIVLNSMEPYRSPERFLRYVNSRGRSSLTEQEKMTLKELIDLRFGGQIDMFKDCGYFQSNKDIDELLSIDKNKRNIFLFSNVYWDLGMSESGQVFNDVITWVLQTISILKDRPDIHLYIKPHPAERFDSASSLKGIADHIYEEYPTLPDNVSLLLPDLKVKTYDLFPYIDLGVVYNGTLGLEMLLHGIPVVVTGKAPYGRLGFVHEPEAVEEYERILLGEIQPITPAKDELDLFAYFYFIKFQIPWTLTERAYAHDFKGFAFNSLEDIMPGKNKYLDHLCECILDPDNTVIEGWQ